MATTGGLFGSKPAATGGLFGTPASTAPTLTATSTMTPAATGGGLFGSATPAAGAGTGTGGLFGAKPAAASGGLFGGAAGGQQQAGTTGGLFGGATATAAAPAATATQPSGGGGLFGGAATTGSAPAATSGGLFGQAAASSIQPKPAGGLFAQSTAQPAATTQVPAVQINYDNLRPRSRFDDLAQPIQTEIDLIDKGIQRVIKMRDEIGQFMPQHERDIEQLGRDVQFVESKFKTVQDALNRDIQTVKVLQDTTKKNIADGQLSFKAADNLKLPTHYHQTGLFAGTPTAAGGPPSSAGAGEGGAPDAASSAHASAQDLITYFNRICDDVERYKKRLDEYRSQIERDMPGVENGLYEQIRSLRDQHGGAGGNGGNGGGGPPMQDSLNQVLSALKETGSAIVAQAGVIAETRERLSRLQAGYLDNAYGVMT